MNEQIDREVIVILASVLLLVFAMITGNIWLILPIAIFTLFAMPD